MTLLGNGTWNLMKLLAAKILLNARWTSVFMSKQFGRRFVFLVLYVDDITLVSNEAQFL